MAIAPGDPGAAPRCPGVRRTGRFAESKKIKKFVFDLGKFCTRTLFWTGVVLSVLLVLVVAAVKYGVLPNIERYQGDIISRVATVSGMDVSANAIRGRWSGFRPTVELENVVFREPASTVSSIRKPGDEALLGDLPFHAHRGHRIGVREEALAAGAERLDDAFRRITAFIESQGAVPAIQIAHGTFTLLFCLLWI